MKAVICLLYKKKRKEWSYKNDNQRREMLKLSNTEEKAEIFKKIHQLTDGKIDNFSSTTTSKYKIYLQA